MMVKTEGLTKVYGKKTAVDSMDLAIREGTVFGFLGPNGAGKTTAINMIVTLLEPTCGRCLIKGIDATRNPIEVKKIIGYVPDKLGFYPNMTGRQALDYYSQFYYLSKREAKKRIEELLSLVGLGNTNMSIGQYSRGMKQRLGIAQAMLNDPEVLFLDEPTTGLDPEGLIMLRNLIREWSRQGKTVLFSTHIIEEVPIVCNKIGIMSNGKLVACGTLDEVRRNLQNDPNYRITIKVKGFMPVLSIPGIISCEYNTNRAVIYAGTDISEVISEEVTKKGLTILELGINEMSLEDLFLETIYRGEKIEA